MTAKIRYAVVGVGGWAGRTHTKCVSEIEGAELVAVVDVNVAAVKGVAEEYKVSWYQDYQEMLDKEKIDAVSLCLPHFLHASFAVEAMSRGVHVLVEKPMAVSVKEADEMMEAAKRKGVKLGVVFQRRTFPVYKELKRMVSEEELGSLLRALLEYATYRDQRYYDSGAWRGTWRGEGGGILINQAVHFIDQFLWILDKRPKTLYALISNLVHGGIEVEDLASAVVEFEGGLQATMQFSTTDHPGLEYIVIRGDRGVIRAISGEFKVAYNKIPLGKAIADSVKEPVLPEYEWRVISSATGLGGHFEVVKDFIQAIMEDREPMVPGEEGRKSLELINAIIMSGVTGQPVNFPLNPRAYERVLNKLKKAKRLMRITG